MSGVDPVQAWRELRDHTHGLGRQAGDRLAAALEAERERADKYRRLHEAGLKELADSIAEVRQRDERIAALEAKLQRLGYSVRA
jgi:DNA-binding PadR family transcriptional regulator